MEEQNELELPIGSSFDPPKKKYISAIYNQWAGLREQAVADLAVYLENPVGVGEHSDIGEEIKKKLQEIDRYDSLVSTIEKHFLANGRSSEVTDAEDEKP